MDKSPWDSKEVFIFFCNFWGSLKKKSIVAVLPTVYKVETRNKFWIRASNALIVG